MCVSQPVLATGLFCCCLCHFPFIFLNLHIYLLFLEYSCLHFPLLLFPAPHTPTSYPQPFPTLDLSMHPLYMFLDNSFPSFSHYLPPSSPLVIVSLFFISISLFIFSSLLVCFVDYVPLIGDIIWYFYFTALLTSFSIML